MAAYVLLTVIFSSLNSPIECRNYIPGTDQVVPRNITYRYTPEQAMINKLRCYCEVVKRVERQCIRTQGRARQCRERTERWVVENIMPKALPRVADIPRRNVIVNVERR